MKRWQPWLVWCAVFAVATVITQAVRPHVDPLHINLLYLLIVLGGSVSEGRGLGLSLSAAAFLAIDYVFQTPYDSFAVGKSLDWVGLLAFLATSAVTSELVTRARAEAARARARAREVGARKVIVDVSVEVEGIPTARGEVVAVRMPDSMLKRV